MLTLAPLALIAQGWKVSKSVDSMTDPLNGAKRVIAELSALHSRRGRNCRSYMVGAAALMAIDLRPNIDCRDALHLRLRHI
jgi:hypothetical protein